MDNNKLNWEGLNLYTKEFKEWIFKLFLKVHARIGHVEEELAKVKEANKSTYSIKKKISSDSIDYVLIDDTTKEERGATISISTGGVVVSTWEEDLNI